MRALAMNPRQVKTTLCQLTLLMFILSAASAFSQPAIVSFEPTLSTIVCTETGTIEVLVDDSIDDLQGFSLVLEFDPELITPISVEAGSLVVAAGCPFTLFWMNPNNSGTIEVDGAMLGCSIEGPGAILSIVFEAAEGVEGQTTLVCQNVTLRDSLNADIPAECLEATINVVCAVNTHQAVLGTVKALFR